MIYHLLGAHKQSSEIVKTIVGKLRVQAPEQATSLEGLTPRQIATKLRVDNGFRQLISNQDFELLQAVTRNEFVKSLVVYGLIAFLFLVSIVAFVYLQTRPVPVVLKSWSIESDHVDAKGMAVDLDPLIVRWQADGPNVPISVFLENVQTNRKTGPIQTTTGEQQVVFGKDDYRMLLAKRGRLESNRIKAVARTEGRSFDSPEVSLHVGITIRALPDEEKSQVIIFASIDNSRVDNYTFEAKVLAWRRPGTLGPETWGGMVSDGREDFPVTDFAIVRWETAKIIYLGPDRAQLIRTVIN